MESLDGAKGSDSFPSKERGPRMGSRDAAKALAEGQRAARRMTGVAVI
jgi:hypothetical protein